MTVHQNNISWREQPAGLKEPVGEKLFTTIDRNQNR